MLKNWDAEDVRLRTVENIGSKQD